MSYVTSSLKIPSCHTVVIVVVSDTDSRHHSDGAVLIKQKLLQRTCVFIGRVTTVYFDVVPLLRRISYPSFHTYFHYRYESSVQITFT